MTIYDAITQFDARYFNTYSGQDKVQWLSRVDDMVTRHILDTHENTKETDFTGYNSSTDLQNTELLVPEPFAELYFHYLEAQVCYHNSEYDKYNNAITLFNAAYESYAAYYHRQNKPMTHGKRFLF